MGQVVLLTGEPGIGKSRLLDALKSELEGSPHLSFECRCSPYHTNAALYPFPELLERSCSSEPGDSANVRFAKLREMLQGIGITDEDAARTLAEMLVLPAEQLRGRDRLTPEERKQAALNLLLVWFWNRRSSNPSC